MNDILMEVISHRGNWKKPSEKNTYLSFESSFSLGFGTETDFRDYLDEIVISHDIPTNETLKAETFFDCYNNFNITSSLALNIKADGLQQNIKTLLEKKSINNYFVFDMSIPDTIGYIDQKIKFFSRQSEYELQPAFYETCNGIWLDAFESEWYDSSLIKEHLGNDKKVAIVSPELHNRQHILFWEYLKSEKIDLEKNVILCTDFPEEAMKYFYE